MPGSLFPVYCRACHKEIDSSAQVCPHCGQAQGLTPPPQQTPPPTQAVTPTQMTQQMQTPPPVYQPPTQQSQGPAACPYCFTVITAGDYFCRACGKGLVTGFSSADKGDVGKAYGISALISLFLVAPLSTIILGIIAIIKGNRSLGCAAIILAILFTIIMSVISGAIVKEFLPQIMPQVKPGT